MLFLYHLIENGQTYYYTNIYINYVIAYKYKSQKTKYSILDNYKL